MQEEDSGNGATSESSAAFSVYYGSNDSRNYTEKFTIDQKQNLDHVYALVSVSCMILLYLHFSLTLTLNTSLGGYSCPWELHRWF